ncbi:iron-containing alcohol dehydrogenase [Alicyclobacillus sp. SO9]|uniref:iron-containing alcohol dehydrogenase n=1 Tax=Alicyclobacillus sp. SO9 TaxID=2665646 RepID=UPI0018E79A7D|nr:iron-containing alcohol dehydrogenase [Alicyclobacillus sp. SO9]QQE78175.1 iron-containing alcohol dehydrogenase [Alicyclobacillus sp. SO9]
MLEFFQYTSPTQIIGGSPGFLKDASPELEAFAGLRAGVVTDTVIARLGFFQSVIESLEDAGIVIADIFRDVPQDSELSVVQRVADEFQQADVNLLVAVGGGSVIDTAKATNILLTHTGQLHEYQGAQTLTEPVLPLVAVPTTVGTGSEVTMVSVISDKADARKLTFVDKALAPTLAILDPAATFTLPVRMVAATAMDAFTHAIEAYVDIEHSPFSDAMAVAAGSAIHQHLKTALQNEQFEDARAELQIASTMAGIAFNHSMVGIVHALAHSLGGVCHVPHGEANSLMLVEGLICNAEVVPDRIAEFGIRTGLIQRSDASVEELAGATIERVAGMRELAGHLAELPLSLESAGVKESDLDLLVQRAQEDGAMVYNPKFVEPDEILQMYQKVMKR